ncbi:hypothetical protein XFF6991_320155 [Xanthomonas phaseoli pv. phaseoli]|uniref:Uncharacterized protein n=1 Tax=Xanthomonas campestris pv. phaseoli TaxID=317013 RepID=A0A7Z7IYW6_XANCH|nr:hypothetical protein XFF6991_320155 [Xanthomonas phaseoli pv. phaseoli]
MNLTRLTCRITHNGRLHQTSLSIFPEIYSLKRKEEMSKLV